MIVASPLHWWGGVLSGPFHYSLDALPATLVITTYSVELEYLTNVLPPPIAYWPFDEGTGTTSVDESGNGHLATLGASATWEAALAKFGGWALENVETGTGATHAVIALGTVHSISWWMNGFTPSDSGDVIHASSGSWIYFWTANDLHYAVNGPSAIWSPGEVTGSHHWCISRDNTSLTAYKDGVSLGTVTVSSNNPFSPIKIAQIFNGVLDDVRYYDTALNPLQVAVLYALDPDSGAVAYTLTALPTALVLTGAAVALDYAPTLPTAIAYWPFNEGTGTTSADASGNGHDATLGVAVWNSALSTFGGWALEGTSTAGTGASITALSLGTVHSISFWIKGPTTALFPAFLWGPSNQSIYISAADDLRYTVLGTNATWASVGASGVQQLVFVRNGTSVTAYKNGVSLGARTLGNNNAFVLERFLNGGTIAVLDDVRVFDFALSAEQVAVLYAHNPDLVPAYSLDALPAALVLAGQSVSLDHVIPAAIPSPIAYWPFNEATGTTAADLTGNDHTATLGPATWNTSTQKFGPSALVNAGGTVAGATMAPIDLGTVHSIATWINGWPNTNDGAVVAGTTGIYALQLLVSGANAYIGYATPGTSTWPNIGPAALLAGSHHLVLTRNGGPIKVYVDGVWKVDASSTGIGLIVSRIASPASGPNAYIGTLDDLRLFDVALTAEQVTALYNLVPTLGTMLDAQPAALSLSGQSVSLDKDWVLDALPATLALTGQSVGLDLGRGLDALPASMLLAGQSVALDVAHGLDAVAASLTISGASVGLDRTWRIDTVTTSLLITGRDVNLDWSAALPSYVLDALPTSLVLSGKSVSLDIQWAINAGSTSLLLTGAAVSLDIGTLAAYSLDALPATVLIEGYPVEVNRDQFLDVLPTSVVITTYAVQLDRKLAIDVLPATLLLSGQAVVLEKGFIIDVQTAGLTISPTAVDLEWLSHLDAVGTATIVITPWDVELRFRRSQAGWDRLLHPPVDGGHDPLSDDLNPRSKVEPFGPYTLHPPVEGDHTPLSDAIHPESLKAFPLRTERLRSYVDKQKSLP